MKNETDMKIVTNKVKEIGRDFTIEVTWSAVRKQCKDKTPGF